MRDAGGRGRDLIGPAAGAQRGNVVNPLCGPRAAEAGDLWASGRVPQPIVTVQPAPIPFPERVRGSSRAAGRKDGSAALGSAGPGLLSTSPQDVSLSVLPLAPAAEMPPPPRRPVSATISPRVRRRDGWLGKVYLSGRGREGEDRQDRKEEERGRG